MRLVSSALCIVPTHDRCGKQTNHSREKDFLFDLWHVDLCSSNWACNFRARSANWMRLLNVSMGHRPHTHTHTYFCNGEWSFSVAPSLPVAAVAWCRSHCHFYLCAPFRPGMWCSWSPILGCRLCSVSFRMAALECAPANPQMLRLCFACVDAHANWPLDVVAIANLSFAVIWMSCREPKRISIITFLTNTNKSFLFLWDIL